MTEIPEPVRSLLAAIAETLDVPEPGVDIESLIKYNTFVEGRIHFVQMAIRDVLTGKADLGVEWEAEFLRKKVAERPPTYRVLAQPLGSAEAEEGR
ncbi:hypothetical protein [Streptomyces sp. S1]|uniref:hypothetical protein n=1 Tax=Streptomyces sp. S1 TaxID=718288 RepID=UPI003D718FEA